MTGINEILADLQAFNDTPASYASDLRASLALLIQRQLKHKGWSQKQLAKSCGYKEPFISRIMNGDANCEMATMGRLLHALGVRATLMEEGQVGTEGRTTSEFGGVVTFSTVPVLRYQADDEETESGEIAWSGFTA